MVDNDVMLQSWRQQWVVSTGCMSNHSGFRDFSLVCGVEDVVMKWPAMISAMSLSAAALHLRAGGLKNDTIRDDNI